MANLTLAIDEDLLRQARKIAIDRNTTVNRMVREFLESSVKQATSRQQARERLLGVAVKVGPITWSREDLYQR